VKDLDYNGLPTINKDRKLSEDPILDKDVALMPPDESDILDNLSTKIFTNLGQTYLKGEVLKKGLRLMEPVQFIPVNVDAEKVSSSCIRVSKEASNNGTIIPFSLFTFCVDKLVDAQWQIRRVYEDPTIPADTESHTKYTTKHYSNKGGLAGFISSFFNGDGIAGAILTALSIAPFQLPGFSVLTIEEGSKAYFVAQVPPAVALLLELGIKAKRLKEFLKAQGKLPADVNSIIDQMDDPIERKKALATVGIDHDQFKEQSLTDDCNVIIQYCNQYIASAPADGPKTYDHWIAYGAVCARQNMVRAALDSATDYSQDFSEAFQRNQPTQDNSGVVSAAYGFKPHTKFNNVIASHYNELDIETNNTYNDILNSFLYQLDDQSLCCLVSLMGTLDTEILKTLATMLRLAATDLNAELARLQDAFWGQLNNLSAAVVYKIIEKLRKLEDKFAVKLLKSLEDVIPSTPACPIMGDIAIALTMALDSMRNQINALLMDILASMDRLGRPTTLSWRVPADRRHLLTIARILDVIAIKLDAAEVCNRKDVNQKQYDVAIAEAKDQAAYEITHSLLVDGSPPSIQISDIEIKKYFPDLQPVKSKSFPFLFGPKSLIANNRPESPNNSCDDRNSKAMIDLLKENLSAAIEKNFK
jgi:hypothetical protein